MRSFFLVVWCKAQMKEATLALLMACVWIFTDYPKKLMHSVVELPEVLNIERWKHNGEQPTQETMVGGRVSEWPAVGELTGNLGYWIH